MKQFKTISNDRLGQILLREGVISEEDLARALKIQTEKGGLLGEILLEAGLILPRDIERVLFLQYGAGFPFIFLPEERFLDLEIIKLVPRYIAERYCLIPFSRYQNVLTVVISNPLNKDEDIFALLKEITGLEIQFFIGLSSQIKKAIKEYYDLVEGKEK
jgi:type IV pilus assembly protein PilB